MIGNKLKNMARDLMPAHYQVPVKYYYNWLASMLEPEMKIIKYLIKEGDRVIDVGGNRGLYAYQFWKIGAKVEVFEPNSKCSDLLAKWAADKGNVAVYPIALSNCTGHSKLYVPVDSSGVEHDSSGSIEHQASLHMREQDVQLRTLDSFEFDNVSLIKIDVEGHEYSVIAGAAKTIGSMKPALLIEIEQRHNARPIVDVFEKILSFGYKGYFLNAGKLMELSGFDPQCHQEPSNLGNAEQIYINNFIFLHQHRVDSQEYIGLFRNFL